MFRQDSSCPGVLWIPPCRSGLRIRGFHPLRPAFPKPFSCPLRSSARSEPRGARAAVWAPPVSLAATPGIDVSFSSSGYLDVSVHRVPLRTLWIGVRMHGSSPCGFPHSEICGSADMCSSPQLIAACHVFHRLLVPRHPPCALSAWPYGLTLFRSYYWNDCCHFWHFIVFHSSANSHQMFPMFCFPSVSSDTSGCTDLFGLFLVCFILGCPDFLMVITSE